MKRIAVILIVVAGIARPARGDWTLSPFVGATFKGSVAESPKVSVGGSVGWTGWRGVGFEVEAAGTPRFFNSTDVPRVLFKSGVVSTLMFNAVVGAPIPGTGDRVHPYVSGGLGVIRSRIGEADDFVRGTNNSFGFNAGVGATSFFSPHLGARGDVRYFRALQDLEPGSEFFSFGSTRLVFWRASGGVVFRF